MERYAKYRIDDDAIEAFRVTAAKLVEAARHAGGCDRFDWFLNETAGEAVCMAAGGSAAGLDFAPELWTALRGVAREELVALDGSGAFRFDDGIDRTASTPGIATAQSGETTLIEIVTWFDIVPGEEPVFQQLAREMTAIVRARDPGTTRYDWLYERAGRRALALDTYAGLDGMIAHMRNCHGPHEQLLKHAKMTTEFLGALAPEVAVAVSKHNPFVLLQVAGL